MKIKLFLCLISLNFISSAWAMADEISFERHPSNPLYAICDVENAAKDNDVICEKSYTETTLQDCYSQSRFEKEKCIGKGRAICSVVTRFNDTLGINYCAKYAFEVWESILATEYEKSVEVAANVEREVAANIESESEGLFSYDQKDKGSLSDSLVKAQTDWLNFRKSECSFLFHLYSRGTARVSYYQGCRIKITAERAIRLNDFNQRWAD